MLKLRDPAPPLPRLSDFLYLRRLQHRLQQYLSGRNCGISKRRALHSCLLHSNVGVLHQAALALGGVTSIRHLHLMARVMVRHAMLHLRDRILSARSKTNSGVLEKQRLKRNRK